MVCLNMHYPVRIKWCFFVRHSVCLFVINDELSSSPKTTVELLWMMRFYLHPVKGLSSVLPRFKRTPAWRLKSVNRCSRISDSEEEANGRLLRSSRQTAATRSRRKMNVGGMERTSLHKIPSRRITAAARISPIALAHGECWRARFPASRETQIAP